MIIVAQNQTAGDLSLKQLSAIDAKIPASGEATLTDYNSLFEILEDSQLLGYVQADSVLLEVDGTSLTKQQSLTVLGGEPTLKHNYSASSSPTVNEDDSVGYSVGSLWIDTTADTVFVCTDSSTGSASWAAAAAGSGITAAQHRVLRQLIHFIDDGPAEGFPSGCYKETTPTGPFPTSEIWWESSSKLKKIVELTTTWTGATITQEVWEVYDTDGSSVLATITDTINYTGLFESDRTRVIA